MKLWPDSIAPAIGGAFIAAAVLGCVWVHAQDDSHGHETMDIPVPVHATAHKVGDLGYLVGGAVYEVEVRGHRYLVVTGSHGNSICAEVEP